MACWRVVEPNWYLQAEGMNALFALRMEIAVRAWSSSCYKFWGVSVKHEDERRIKVQFSYCENVLEDGDQFVSVRVLESSHVIGDIV